MTEDNLRAVMALADAYALTGYSAVSLTLAQAMPQRAALESALRAELASARAAAMEEAARICESAQDHREGARALLAASKALNEGNEGDILSRLRHESLVGFMNSTCARNAGAIREAITEGAKP